MQKLAYFCGLELGTPLGYRPHYFGPYSAKVEDALSNATIAGDLRETVEQIPSWWGESGPDVMKYTYELKAEGRDRVTRVIEDHPEEWRRVKGAVDAIKDVLPSLDTKTLSSAAKTYLIISESEEGVEEAEIPKLAKRLGWNLDRRQVSTTVELLSQLELIDDSEGSAQPE